MADTPAKLPLGRLVAIPAIVTLAVTFTRLVGELREWPSPWFEPDSAIVGITWLAPIFGGYFAVKLFRAGEVGANLGRAFAFAVLGLALNQGSVYLAFQVLHINIFRKLITVWIFAALSAALQYRTWPALFKTLMVYGYAARIPVAILMLLSMRGHWGTHYDSGPPIWSFWMRYIWFAFFAQLVYWVGFTVISGTLLGSITVAAVRRFRPLPQAGSAV